MASRKPLVHVTGRIQQLPDGDTIDAVTSLASGRAKASGGATFYHAPGVDFSGVGTRAIVANTMYYAPWFVDGTIVIDQFAAEITTAGAAGTLARLGIYRADADWQPTDEVVEGAEISIAAVGVVTSAITDTTLNPGRYLAAITCSGAPTFREMRGGQRYIGLSTAFGTSPFRISMTVGRAYAALPATGVAWTTTTSSSSPYGHYVFCRIKSLEY